MPVPFAMAFVDLDDLRAFNAMPDNYDSGDEALRTVVRLLDTVDPNGQVSRWGGDEFVVAVPGRSADHPAERLRELVHTDRGLKVGGRRVTFSAGVAEAITTATATALANERKSFSDT